MNNALINFKFNQIKQNDPYTLILDCDEFIYSFNEHLSLSKLIGQNKGLYIRWLMNPLTKSLPPNSGFLGSAGKQIANTEQILKIENCHRFKFDKGEIKDEASRFGVFLIHNWSRSLNDCLIKSTYSKIKNEKTIDQNQIHDNLKKGKLFSRAKYLAFLDIQTRYITGFNDKYKNHFDKEKEFELISAKYSQNALEIFYELYEEYKNKLLNSSNFQEIYPPYEGGILEQMRRLNS